MRALPQIESDVNQLAQFIGATANELPTCGRTRDLGYSHVEVDSHQYHLVSVERGAELVRRSTPDYDELLYWIFHEATHSLAFAYELAHRIENQDCRRLAFPRQIELMSLIRPQFGNRCAAEIQDVLQRYPYDDGPSPSRPLQLALRSNPPSGIHITTP